MRTLILAALAVCAAHAQCVFYITPSEAAVQAAAATGTIIVRGPLECVRTAVSNAAWINVVFGQTGTGDGKVGWAVDANVSASARTGTLTVAGQTFTITQAGANCIFTLVPTSRTAPVEATGVKDAFTVKSTCTFTPVSNVPWITIDEVSLNKEVHYTVAPNPLSATRTGTIQVGDQFFYINQNGPCFKPAAPPTAPLPVEGGAFTFPITGSTGCAWTASSAVSWITVTSGASGSGGGTVGYRVAANNAAQRSGAIRVNDQSYNVTQSGVACVYTLNPVSSGMAAAGGTGTFSVVTDARCSWTPVSGAAWVRISAGAPLRTGPGTVEYVVDPNPLPNPRTAIITLSGAQFTVNQNGAAAQVQLTAIGSAASYVQTGVTAGELIYIGGSGMGPATLATLELTSDQLFVTTSLAGTRVLFDGKPAPMIYTRNDAVSAIVPNSVGPQSTTRVEVEYQGNRSTAMTMNVLPAKPGIFSLNASGSGQAAALNQDLSVNGANNPAERGQVIVLYATGGGETDPPSTDGRIATDVFPKPRLAVTVTIGGVDAPVQYAGAAPGLVAGVLQVNAVIPAEIAPGDAVPVVLKVGGYASQPNLTIAVK